MEMTMPDFPKVSDKQAAVLRALCKWLDKFDGAPDAVEIVRMYRGAYHYTSMQVASALRELEVKDLTEKLGVTFTGGQRYGITDLGRALGVHLEADEAARYDAAKRDPSGPKV
jgi:hypothetical protein